MIEVFDANICIFEQIKKLKQKKQLIYHYLRHKIGILANIFGILMSESDKK